MKIEELPITLNGGLVLRRATARDTEQLISFNAIQHADDPESPSEMISEWARDVFSGRHPTSSIELFYVVIDPSRDPSSAAGGRIVSSMGNLPQTWCYNGISFPVGRAEMVATDPDYRRMGLIQKQFELFHQDSEARGELVQAIHGIPYYYRQFGYGMPLDLAGRRTYPWDKHGPVQPSEGEHHLSLRSAQEADCKALGALYELRKEAMLVHRVRAHEEWLYEMRSAHRESPAARNFVLFEDIHKEVVGYVEYQNWQKTTWVREFSVNKDVPLVSATDCLIQRILAERKEKGEETPQKKATLVFNLGRSHPVYDALNTQLTPLNSPYAWYLRVPDIPGFLMHIRPVLEERLARSEQAEHTGTLKLNLYSCQLTLTFDSGKLVDMGSYIPKKLESGDAFIHKLSFLDLLFGFRSIDALTQFYPDCNVKDDAVNRLLRILFPQRDSHLVPLN